MFEAQRLTHISNMLLTRTRPSMYIPAWTALWSIVSAATAGAGTYTHLIVIRFFLGIAEAPFFPGMSHPSAEYKHTH